MAEIVIRWAPEERTLRSTGEPAGILVFAFPGGHPSYAVDRGWEPRPEAADTVLSSFEDGISPLAEAVSIADVVEGCFSLEELTHLWLFTAQTFHAGIQLMLGQQAFDAMRELVDFAEEVAATIDAEVARRKAA